MKNKRPIYILLTIAAILLIPLIAMQFTNEVNWSLGDFAMAAVLLLGSGFVFEMIVRNVKTIKHRIIFYIAIIILLLLVWAELAVGILRSPFAGQ